MHDCFQSASPLKLFVTIIIIILQMWKLRYRKSKLFAYGFRPIKRQSQGLNVPSLFPQSICNLLKQYKTLGSSNWSMAFNCGYRNQTQFFLASATWKFGAVSRPSAVGLSDQAFSPSRWSSLLYHLDLFKDCKKCQRTSGFDEHRLYYHTLWCPLYDLLLWMICTNDQNSTQLSRHHN